MRKLFTIIMIIAAFGSMLVQPIQAQVHKKPSPVAPPEGLNLFNPNKWVGTWERRVWLENGYFTVQNVSGNTLSFDFVTTSGSLRGDIKGNAYLKDNRTAVFSSPLHSGCKITIHMLSDSVVTIDGNHCDPYAKRVNYSGKFINNKFLPQEMSQTMISLHVLNQQQDAALRKLADTNYSTFLKLTQRVTQYKPQKQGGNDVKIFSAKRDGIEGLAEYIMMVDNANHIWAALLEGGVDILYYTNTPDKKTLPQPIVQWRSRLPRKYPVKYMNN